MHRNLFLFLILLVYFINSAIVNTNYGSIQGLETLQNHRIHHSFKRIPYAKAPVGNLRFKKPELPDLWTEIKDGTAYGPACMSNSTTSLSPQKWIDEDCLHVNIFVSDYCLKSKNCSVAVYIHGGDLNYDSAVMFNDTYIFNVFTSKDVILVIPGFRLGIFSHLMLSDQKLVPHNIAIYDILMSFEFVQAEIQHFGGNSNSVTAMGHSYGGVVTSHMVFSTKINQDLRLFQKVIAMSAPTVFLPVESSQIKSDIFVKKSGCQPKNRKVSNDDSFILKCLQAMNSQDLLRIQRELEENGVMFEGVVQSLPLFQSGSITEFHENPKKIPYLTGVLTHELDNDEAEFLAGQILGFKNEEVVLKKYLNDKKFEGKSFNHSDETNKIFIDTQFRALKILETGAPVYLYEYSNPTHTHHGNDMAYLLGIHPFNKTIDEQKLSEVYPEYFMNFIKSGKPADNWEVTNGTTYFDIDWNEDTGKRPIMRNGFEKQIMDYWFIEMRKFDELMEKIKKSKTRNTFKSFDSTRLPQIDTNLVFWLSSCLIFLVGILVGRCLCAPRRNLYVQIPGNDYYDTLKI